MAKRHTFILTSPSTDIKKCKRCGRRINPGTKGDYGQKCAKKIGGGLL